MANDKKTYQSRAVETLSPLPSRSSGCGRRTGRWGFLCGTVVLVIAFTGCGQGGGQGQVGSAAPGGSASAQLERVEYGRLVDVYGLSEEGGETTIELYRKDVLIGGNIEDQRPAGSTLSDSEVRFDFIGSDPDTLQAKLLLPRELGSAAFNELFDLLDDELRTITPMRVGTAGPGTPFSVVPRNGGLRLTFSAPLGVDDSYFVERNDQGQVTALTNTEAVQLLQIVPNGFVPLPVRIVARGNELMIDPVLLGTEGQQYQTVNNPAGLPASPDQLGANIRIAVALEGPLAIPGLRESSSNGLTGLNNSQRNSIIRDFRSGNANDDSADIAGGFVLDTLPLRVIGEIPMYLERVDEVNSVTQEVTIYKGGVSHEIDRGDVIRFVADSSGVPVGSAEVIVDPSDDFGSPSTQHVRVRIRRVKDLATYDPRNLPGYPASIADREPWLVQYAPRAVCIAEYSAGGSGAERRDDPRNFLTFTPRPLVIDGYTPRPDEYVSPRAGAVVRFTKPVDLASVKWADTFFFGMRDLTSQASIDEFRDNRPNNANGLGMESLDAAKYRTPFLITARVFDEDGSQTSLRLQPTSGFYLDDTLRNPPPTADYRYFLHLIAASDDGGIRDLAGNPLDLQGTTADSDNSVVIPFTLDTRVVNDLPVFPDNLVVSVVRRFASRDEDAQPSYFLADEVQAPGTQTTEKTYALEDLFGAFLYVDNQLQSRPTTRQRVVADNLNQSPFQAQPLAPQPPNPLAACPYNATNPTEDPPSAAFGGTQTMIGGPTAGSLVPAGIQNPLNPYGCRLQTLWREIDLSLSRDNPFDFNLDIEQMYWAPFTETNLLFDEFDRTSLWLGHAEYRPIPCVGIVNSVPMMPESGLRANFEKNFAWNPRPEGGGTSIESQAPRVAPYVDRPLTIDPSAVVYEPTGNNRFLPLPAFQKPYFVYRDETVVQQGGKVWEVSAVGGSDQNTSSHVPYVLSPWLMGLGRHWVLRNPGDPVSFATSFWNDGRNRLIGQQASDDSFTGGLLGNVALPLLADFWTYCDSSALPVGGGYIALGTNGWQTAVTVQSDPRPRFRIVTAGSPSGCKTPGDSSWTTATTTPGVLGGPGDNTFYWIMMDVLKRQSVVTNGFLDIYNPHRVPEGFSDPRLGPFYLVADVASPPAGVLPNFSYEFDPPLASQPAGTSVVPQFRGAGTVDPTPWYWNAWVKDGSLLYPTADYSVDARQNQLKPSSKNFPLDPFKAGDAHMRKWDTRPLAGSGQARNWWTYLYNRTVTSYVENPNTLMDPAYTGTFSGPFEAFEPRDVRYVNWRFVIGNNAEASPPVSPSIETFALSYRFEQQ